MQLNKFFPVSSTISISTVEKQIPGTATTGISYTDKEKRGKKNITQWAHFHSLMAKFSKGFHLKETACSIKIGDGQIQGLPNEDWGEFHIKHHEQYLHIHLTS